MANTQTLKLEINDKFSFYFDELQNIEIANRKSDIGFSDI